MKRLNLIDKAFLLKRTSIFGTLDLDLLLAIADKLEAVEFDAGEVIFPIGQEAHRMYLIARGSVVIQDGHHRPLAQLATADIFGDESLFNEKPRAYEAISETDTLLMTLSRSYLSSIFSEYPSVALSFLQEYASSATFRPRRKVGEGNYMSIRSRLFLWFLPLLIAFVALVSSFFYLNWYWEILSGFNAHLQSVVVSSSELFNPQDISWIDQHRRDPDVTQSPEYQKTLQKLVHLQEKLALTDLYVVVIEPVKKGETVLDKPPSATNKIYDGIDKNYAYREVYLLDAAGHPNPVGLPNSGSAYHHQPGDFDFTESQEHTIYFTKEPFVTPIYQARDTKQRFMTAYAPIMDSNGNVAGLIAADVTLKVIDSKLKML